MPNRHLRRSHLFTLALVGIIHPEWLCAKLADAPTQTDRVVTHIIVGVVLGLIYPDGVYSHSYTVRTNLHRCIRCQSGGPGVRQQVRAHIVTTVQESRGRCLHSLQRDKVIVS